MSRHTAERISYVVVLILAGLYVLFGALTRSNLLDGIHGTPAGVALSVVLSVIIVAFGVLLILPIRD